MSNNTTTAGRRAKFTEERAKAMRREDARYGFMAREPFTPSWADNPAELPKRPPPRRTP